MSCDIHTYVEKRIEGVWVMIQPGQLYVTDGKLSCGCSSDIQPQESREVIEDLDTTHFSKLSLRRCEGGHFLDEHGILYPEL